MNENYKKFLRLIGIIYEEEFDNIINSFPEVNIDNLDLDLYDASNIDAISYSILNEILSTYQDCWADDISFENKTFYLYDVQSLEDLESIKSLIPEWTIVNYEELKEEVKIQLEEEKLSKEKTEKFKIINKFLNKISIEELEKIAKQYD